MFEYWQFSQSGSIIFWKHVQRVININESHVHMEIKKPEDALVQSVCVYKWKSVFQPGIHFCCCSFMSKGKDHFFSSLKFFVRTLLGWLCPWNTPEAYYTALSL